MALTGTITTFTDSILETVFTGTITTGFICTNNTPSDMVLQLTADEGLIIKKYSTIQIMGSTGSITATAQTLDGFETTGEFYFISM